jgi:hypothetical protein
MTNEEKDKIKDKWGPIINSMGITGSKADWMAEYANKQNETLQVNTLASDGTTSDFPSILPMAMRVASQTVGLDLVSVKPMESINHEEMDRIKNEVKAENRERKIDALTENKDFEEMKVEEHPDYKIPGPTGKLFYLDFQYGTASI